LRPFAGTEIDTRSAGCLTFSSFKSGIGQGCWEGGPQRKLVLTSQLPTLGLLPVRPRSKSLTWAANLVVNAGQSKSAAIARQTARPATWDS